MKRGGGKSRDVMFKEKRGNGVKDGSGRRKKRTGRDRGGTRNMRSGKKEGKRDVKKIEKRRDKRGEKGIQAGRSKMRRGERGKEERG